MSMDDPKVALKIKPYWPWLTVVIVLGLLGFLPHRVIAKESMSVNEVTKIVSEGELARDNGDLMTAQHDFDEAIEASRLLGGESYPAALAASGYNLFLLNKKELAKQQLKEAYGKSQSGMAYLHALCSVYLASVAISEGELEIAKQYLDVGKKFAGIASDKALAASIAILQLGLTEGASATAGQLDSLYADTMGITEPFVKAKLLLALGDKFIDASATNSSPDRKSSLARQAYDAITESQRLVTPDRHKRFIAESTASLSRLYLSQGRNDEALTLTNRAIDLLTETKATELSAKLWAQKGSLLKSAGDYAGARDAYGQAVADLKSIRSDIPINLPDGKSSIDTFIDPIYRGYADLLLRRPQGSRNAVKDEDMAAAIDSMEAIKVADLQDFFLGRCSISLANGLDWRKQKYPNSAIVYPILFDDRLEMIVKDGAEVFHRTIPVPARDIQQQAAFLALALHSGKDYRLPSKQLYEWLFAPIADDLRKLGPETIVYVPDRSIRAIPYAALYDGKKFVVETYGVATLPSLDLENLSRQRASQQENRTLVAGISKPDGPSVDQLPEGLVKNVLEKPQPGKNPTAIEAAARSALIDELSLPGVEKEVQFVAQPTSSRTLLNNQFTASALTQNIESGEYGKVHIASHGYFGKNAKESFVMAYDQNLTLIDFEQSLNSSKLKTAPIDLLTLSACETAEGDDRMLLGFSGLAIKSNALSALGSLWSISDAAALEFMKVFYDGLNKSLSKGKALRQAQLSLIGSKKFRHPFFWSPFILVGNWM